LTLKQFVLLFTNTDKTSAAVIWVAKIVTFCLVVHMKSGLLLDLILYPPAKHMPHADNNEPISAVKLPKCQQVFFTNNFSVTLVMT